MATKKTKNKASNKSKTVNFDDSVKTLKTTVKSISRQIENLSDDIAIDLLENGELITEKATQKVKKAYSKISDTVTYDNLTKTTKEVNKYAVTAADDIVDEMYTNGQKWQKVGDKAVKGGLKLAAKQQDIIFDTLETVKGQFANTANRIVKIFSNN